MRILLACCLFPAFHAVAVEFDTEQMLTTHNEWRKRVGVPALSYSAELAADAQTWAEHLQRTNHCRMQHSKSDGQYGENLYWASAIRWSDGRRDLHNVSAKKVVDSWAAERGDYDYRMNRCAPGKMCGHYTQVVWRSTTRVGCGVAMCSDSKEQVWVCRYQTPGNWVGERPY